MFSGFSARVLLTFGFVLCGCNPMISATLLLHNEPEVLFGNGTGASGGGILNDTVEFSTSIETFNANDQDSAFFQTVDNVLRTWIEDSSDDQVDWNSTFRIEFQHPVNGLSIVPNSPQNSSDSVIWNVGWNGSSNRAAFTNSPNTVNEHSLYDNGNRLATGVYESGTPFRLDDDSTFGEDTNGTTPNDLNIGMPSSPWSVNLPDAITSLTVQAQVASGGSLNMAREGFGIDFSSATLVPEPSGVAMQLMFFSIVVFLRRPA